MASPTTISDYIQNEPAPVRKVLKTMHAVVRKAAPKATEKLAWGMPTLYLEGNLVHFAAFKNHMSLFPGSDAIVFFKRELSKYTTSRGTVQFPYEKPLPTALITRIVKYCMKRNLTKAAAKKAKKKTTRRVKSPARTG